MSSFAIKVRDFEGPLDILLNLIEDRKMLISDVSLSSVADDFLKYIEGKGGIPLGETAQFILVSATLLLLKSRSLLPVLSLTDEEEGDIKDLEFRLKLYQVYRQAAKSLPNGAMRIFFGMGAKSAEPIFTPSRDLSAEALREAASRVLMNAPKIEARKETTVQSVISLEDMIDRLSNRIQSAIEMSFKDFSSSASDKRELVVSFLAMLELAKRGLVLVRQDSQFGDIRMNYSGEVSAPRYD